NRQHHRDTQSIVPRAANPVLVRCPHPPPPSAFTDKEQHHKWQPRQPHPSRSPNSTLPPKPKPPGTAPSSPRSETRKMLNANGFSSSTSLTRPARAPPDIGMSATKPASVW